MDRTRTRSAELYQQALTLMPGGVSSPVRAFRSVSGTPVYFRDAQGARFHDEDGNTYVDYCMSWGPLILGHSHPAVLEAVCEAATAGLSFGACSRREIELAELILSAFNTMDQLRFVSSGTEAVMTAIRLARGATGRSKILKFEGGYHGHSDSLLVKAGSGLATLGTSSSLGVPEAVASETIVCPFDHEDILNQIFTTFGPQLAAAIVEPLPANNGLLEQRPAWLRRLRDLCSRYGALLIFDEVISGFRLRFGGYGDSLGIPADLITLGKIIGGGMPVGALVGPKQLMQHLAPVGNVYQAGTLSGNPVTMAAGNATLSLLRNEEIYQQIELLGNELDRALQQGQTQLSCIQWRRVGSIVWLHLAEGPVPRSADTILPEAIVRFKRVHGFSLDRGIYLPPSAYEVFFLSAAHAQPDMHDLAKTITEALR
jgi:glutamate-1-semialdehyde 2,1-aminomutase